MTHPLVSILCLAYNQEKFIRQALDGFLMQKTNFPFEVLIHDDASTDKTADIIREYQKKYPDIIKPIYQKENQFSQGKDILIDCMLDKVKGKYVAINEGDDYWIDENKLQRQVEFLEAHPDYTICFHPVKVIWEDGFKSESIFPTPHYRFNKKKLSLEDLLKHNFIQTNSVMYRWNLNKKNWPKKDFLPSDYMWHLIHAKYGKIGFLPQVMAVYRRNQGGIWTGYCESDQWFLKCALKNMRFYQLIQNEFQKDKSKEIISIGRKLLPVLVKYKSWNTLEDISKEFPSFWEEFLKNDSFEYHKKLNKLKNHIKVYQIAFGILFFLIIAFCFLKGVR